MTRGATLRWAGLLLLGVLGLACKSSDTGPNTPLAIEFNGPQLPSMVVGDVLHDTLGNVDSLRAIVYNASGDTIANAPVRYVRADTTHIVTIDSISGRVTALDTGAARVVAQVSNLQSPPDTLFVVQAPTSFAQVPGPDTLKYASFTTDTLFALSVALASNGNGVNHYRVQYRFVYPAALNVADTTQVLLSDESRHFSLVDTTAAGSAGVAGAATRYLRILPSTQFKTDSVVVEASAFLPNHTPVPGSPVRFKVLVQIQ